VNVKVYCCFGKMQGKQRGWTPNFITRRETQYINSVAYIVVILFTTN